MEDVTSILAAPREFARRYENMEAQLAQLRSELQTAHATAWAITAERDAARAEVARLRTVAVEVLIHHSDNHCDCDWCYSIRKAFGIEIRAALRGDTAPATGRG